MSAHTCHQLFVAPDGTTDIACSNAAKWLVRLSLDDIGTALCDGCLAVVLERRYPGLRVEPYS